MARLEAPGGSGSIYRTQLSLGPGGSHLPHAYPLGELPVSEVGRAITGKVTVISVPGTLARSLLCPHLRFTPRLDYHETAPKVRAQFLPWMQNTGSRPGGHLAEEGNPKYQLSTPLVHPPGKPPLLPGEPGGPHPPGPHSLGKLPGGTQKAPGQCQRKQQIPDTGAAGAQQLLMSD
ncbi:uncharacterized protein LOC102737498 isoform X2 [Leptonychotes weddellii]|uniref:Uncharacterized protein LOC102737498 isoform X2 n=1 Tax=Leptonychotes weddellii TaxID=9713 RepID=A0A7F8R739_LEPWE|nr:uncharacterized protein LOC102737498 isoform X2 [Leptonychotes weddellii]